MERNANFIKTLCAKHLMLFLQHHMCKLLGLKQTVEVLCNSVKTV